MAGPRREHRHVPSAQPPAALLADGGVGGGDEAGAAPAEVLPLALLGEELQLPALGRIQRIAVLGLAVVGGQLMQELPHAVPLPGAVHIWHLLLWPTAEKLGHLLGAEAGGGPRELFRGASGIGVGPPPPAPPPSRHMRRCRWS